jgi:esterase/lipase superfamily enzyme
MYPAPGGTHLGNFIAWDAVEGEIVWSLPEPFSVWSGALATAGDVVFYGTLEGYLKAVDAETGQELYRFKTPSGIIGNVNTWMHDGKQHIGVLSGIGGWAGIGLAAGLTEDTAGLGAVGAYKALSDYTQLGGVLTVFTLPVGPSGSVESTVARQEYTTVPVFYATDRNATNASSPAKLYGEQRGDDMSYGILEVSVPLDHRLGQLESPSFWHLEFTYNPRKHVMLKKIDTLPKSDFFMRLRSQVDNSSERDVFVFVHGFNVNFEDAARRTGQMAYDLNFQGAPILYSWPAPKKYLVALNNAERTASHLQKFLIDVAERSGAKTIHLIAHSMGNKALVDALSMMAPEPLFNEIFLTAPDIDADVFRDLANRVLSNAQRVTLYASKNDVALHISRAFNGSPRAGDVSSEVVIVEGMDTIDASAVDTSLVGHSYYGDNRSILSDIFSVLRTHAPVMERFGLSRAQYKGEDYYIFRP